MSMLFAKAGEFLRFFGAEFSRDNLPQAAGALAYATLISMVPLSVVMFAVATAFPAFSNIGYEIQDFIFRNFVPAAGEVVHQHLQEFANKASRLTATGILFLVVAALLLIATIDRSFNAIWKAPRTRSAVSEFMVYWALLTLAPVLIGASFALTSYIVSSPLFTEADTLGVRQRAIKAMPFMVSTAGFVFLYMVVPNVRVFFRHALFGGLVAAVLFEMAKRGFAFFVTQFPTYELIYGALAAIPIFLVWLFLCWLIALFGAEITYCLSSFQARDGVTDDSDELDETEAAESVQGEDGTVISLPDREPGAEREV